MKQFKEFLNEQDTILNESNVRDAEKAINASDARITFKKGSSDPLAKSKYVIEVYSPSVNKSNTFIFEVDQIRSYYMS